MSPPAFLAARSASEALCSSVGASAPCSGATATPMLAPGRAWRGTCAQASFSVSWMRRAIDLGVARAAGLRLDDGELVVADPRQPLRLLDQDEQPLGDAAQELRRPPPRRAPR